MPVSDAAALRAAEWLAAWARAGLLGSDPEVVGYVQDLVNFVGERAMGDELLKVFREENSRILGRFVDLFGTHEKAKARVRELEADKEHLADVANKALAATAAALKRVAALEAENDRLRDGLRAIRRRVDCLSSTEARDVGGVCDELLGGAG